MKLRHSIIAIAASICMTGCVNSPQSTHRLIQMTDETPPAKLLQGQNAIIHYILEDGSLKYKHCKIVSADDYWLTVADKAEKNTESNKLSGWHSMIPIENIVMIRVEIDPQQFTE